MAPCASRATRGTIALCSVPRVALEAKSAESTPKFLTRNADFLSRIPPPKNVPRKPLFLAASGAILRARSRNGVGGPLGIETAQRTVLLVNHRRSKWRGRPVGD